MEFKWVRKIPPRSDELAVVGWRTFTAKGEVGESVPTWRWGPVVIFSKKEITPLSDQKSL